MVLKPCCDFCVDRIASFSREFLEFRFQYWHALGNLVDLGAAAFHSRKTRTSKRQHTDSCLIPYLPPFVTKHGNHSRSADQILEKSMGEKVVDFTRRILPEWGNISPRENTTCGIIDTFSRSRTAIRRRGNRPNITGQLFVEISKRE